MSIAKPYLLGARLQLSRYQEARSLCTDDAILGVQLCLHEASCLFEDLDVIGKYFDAFGLVHDRHKLWNDIRNHIRHDLREAFDRIENRKTERATRLNISDKLQMDIGFNKDSIKIGGILVRLSEVEVYLDWADAHYRSIIDDAKSKGLMRTG